MKNKIKIILILLSVLFLHSCKKEIPKDITNKQMPNDSIHRNLMPKNQSGNNEPQSNGEDTKGDPKADQITKEADDADAQYQKTKSETDKKTAAAKQLAAANYLMFEANLSPKKKYRPALKRYNRVLELDPGNKEARENKQQIEDIYKSMGMPVPDA